jgi:hypothetical protein
MKNLVGSCGSARLTLLVVLLLAISACTPTSAALPITTDSAVQPAASPTQGQLTSPQKIAGPTATAQAVIINTVMPPVSLPEGTLSGPLSIVIESPADNETVTQTPLEIRGQAEPNTVITFNDTIIVVGDDGRFSVKIDLEDGINIIEIIASDLDENEVAYYLTVEYEPQP